MYGMIHMHVVHIGNLDLNLLRVLDALLEQRSVTQAGQKLGLSQSATSHALGRLREALGDPLLVRSKRGWLLTPRALLAAEPLRQALVILESVVTPAPAFNPSTSTGQFTLATADYAEFLLLPKLAHRLNVSAPGFDVWSQPYTVSEPLRTTLETVDAVITPRRPEDSSTGIYEKKLFRDRFVCIVRKGHPALQKRWTPEVFASLRHAFIAPQGKPGGVVDEALAAHGLTRRVVVAVPHFLVAPFLISETDAVLTVPMRVARVFAQSLPLELVSPPFDVPGFEMSLFWHERTHSDASHSWFREQIVQICRQISAA